MDISKNFFKHVSKTSKCWEWTGYRLPGGYGMYRAGNRGMLLAHRASWEIHNGKVPPGMFVCHSCDVRWCVNPDHLWIGTRQQNIDDMVNKGRSNRPRGEKNGRAVLDNSKAEYIRFLYKTGKTQTELAAMFSVSQTAIWRVVSGLTWATR